MSYFNDQVQDLGQNGLRVTIQTGVEERATFTFTEIEQSRSQSIDALLLAVVHLDGEAVPFSGHVNLLSLSSRSSFATAFGKAVGKRLVVDIALSRAIESVLDHLANRDTSHDIDLAVEDAPPPDPIMRPLIQDEAPNLIFGKGGTGKTWLAIRLAMSLAVPLPMCGLSPLKCVRTLFVDYEDSLREFRHRVKRIAAGFGTGFEAGMVKSMIRYIRPMAPLHDMIPAMRKIIRDHSIGLVIVDSAMLACGGEPEKAETAIRYFNALSRLEVATLTIGHETKAEEHKYPFGSIVWWNSPRNIWNVRGQGEDDTIDQGERTPVEKPVELALFHKKNNSGPISPMLTIRITHGEKSTEFSEGQRRLWEPEMNTASRIVSILGRLGMAGKARLEDEMPDVDKNTLKTILSRLVQRGTVYLMGGHGGEYRLNSQIINTEQPKKA